MSGDIAIPMGFWMQKSIQDMTRSKTWIEVFGPDFFKNMASGGKAIHRKILKMSAFFSLRRAAASLNKGLKATLPQ